MDNTPTDNETPASTTPADRDVSRTRFTALELDTRLRSIEGHLARIRVVMDSMALAVKHQSRAGVPARSSPAESTEDEVPANEVLAVARQTVGQDRGWPRRLCGELGVDHRDHAKRIRETVRAGMPLRGELARRVRHLGQRRRPRPAAS